MAGCTARMFDLAEAALAAFDAEQSGASADAPMAFDEASPHDG
jgi:hypothetical protein